MKSFFTIAAAVALSATTAAIPQAESSSTLSFTLLSSIPNSAQAPTGTITEDQPTCVTLVVSAPTLRGTTTSVSSNNILTTSVPTVTASATERTSSLSSETSQGSPTLVGRQNSATSVTGNSSVTSIAAASSSSAVPTVTVSSAVTASPSACTVTVTLNASGSIISGIISSTALPSVSTIKKSATLSSASSPGVSGTSSLFNSASSFDVHVHSVLIMTLLAGLVIAVL